MYYQLRTWKANAFLRSSALQSVFVTRCPCSSGCPMASRRLFRGGAHLAFPLCSHRWFLRASFPHLRQRLPEAECLSSCWSMRRLVILVYLPVFLSTPTFLHHY